MVRCCKGEGRREEERMEIGLLNGESMRLVLNTDLADCERIGNDGEWRTEDKNKGNVMWRLRREGIF